MTAFDVAKPEFRAAFGADTENVRSVSSLSNRTIRPSTSFASLSSFKEWTPVIQAITDDDTSLFFTPDFDVSTSSHQLLANLRQTSPILIHDPAPTNLNYLESMLSDTADTSYDILRHFRARTNDADLELREALAIFNRVSTLRDVVSQDVEVRLKERGLQPIKSRRQNRSSEDSQVTAVSSDAGGAMSDGIKRLSVPNSPIGNVPAAAGYRHVQVSTEPLLLGRGRSIGGVRSVPWPERLDGFILSADSTTYKAHLKNLIQIEHGLCDDQASLDISINGKEPRTGSPRKDGEVKPPTRKQLKDTGMKATDDDKMATERALCKRAGRSGTAKLKAWLKKKVRCDQPLKLEIVRDINEESCAVGREVKGVGAVPGQLGSKSSPNDVQSALIPTDKLLLTSHFILDVASRDLASIRDCMSVVSTDLLHIDSC